MAWKEIVGKSFSIEAFKDYVKKLNWTDWKPSFIVLHNTGVPTLASYPNGLTHRYINVIVADYYRYELGWSAGPHLFVDDKQIWVFTPLTTSGVHSPSWNRISLGVEMLGDYDTERFNDGRGALVRDNAAAAIAILSNTLNIDPSTMKIHREDPKTTHHCPGNNVDKAKFINLVKLYIDNNLNRKVVMEPVVVPEPIIIPDKVEEPTVLPPSNRWWDAFIRYLLFWR